MLNIYLQSRANSESKEVSSITASETGERERAEREREREMEAEA